MKRNGIDMEKVKFLRMGREAFEKGLPRQPFKCEKLQEIWKSEPCEIGSALAKKHQEQTELWLCGWDIANLTAHIN